MRASAGNNPFSEDNAYREYHYENATNGKLLTGITDERGNRYATWAYDAQGRAISSEHANTTEKASLDYTHQEDATDPRVTVTNALGKQTTYHFEALHGVRKVTKVEGHQSANCAAANQETTYDENGFVASQTDWKGNLTTYINNDRGLETSRTVASGTPEAQTITTVWHDSFNQPESITEPSRVTNFTYDNQGQRLTTSITDNP
ncbi:MAG: yd repeat-containing protein [Osedax symbiont Rs1]|nr:MAG: yd repeat-containing protein [Osedax symbiont Rs1]